MDAQYYAQNAPNLQNAPNAHSAPPGAHNAHLVHNMHNGRSAHYPDAQSCAASQWAPAPSPSQSPPPWSDGAWCDNGADWTSRPFAPSSIGTRQPPPSSLPP